MLSLEEHSKICGLISSCNEMIDGKFILADYKIANILKNITSSKEVYNLIANQMNNFNFEREFSKAQLRGSAKPNKFKLPDEDEKVLPFIFCILVGIKNKELDFDFFLKEYYSDENGRAEEYSNFASEIILPFRNIIAKYFEISVDELNKNNISKNSQNFEIPSIKKDFYDNEENLDSDKERKKDEIDIKERKGDKDMTNETLEMKFNKVEQFLAEVTGICKDIKSELSFDKRVNKDLKDDIIYITNAILSNCEMRDFNNVVAFITVFNYMASNVRSIKFLTKELKRLIIDFFNE